MSVGIIGAGASGCICAYYLLASGCDVTIFDLGNPLRTLLPTGGGRCNLAYAEYDFKELAKNYPRGEKFLYSVFSRFSTCDTLSLFEELGVETYAQDDGRIFPVSNSAKDVRTKILDAICKAEFIKEGVKQILPIVNGYKIITNKAEYFFDKVVLATGGMNKHGVINGVQNKVTDLKPSLVGLNSSINFLSGIVLKDVLSKEYNLCGDILFTHFGVSGPLIYKISSIKAYDKFPYKVVFDLYSKEFNMQDLLNSNPQKEMKNVLANIFPHRFAEYIAGDYANTKSHLINGEIRDKILNKIHNFEIVINGSAQGEETVTAGGYDLDSVYSKTMESKIHKGMYIIGEALDVDGFCGGFNLQNAWSTAYIAAISIAEGKE